MEKPRNYFARNKDVVSEKKKVLELHRKQREVKKHLKELVEMYKLPIDLMDRIPFAEYSNLLEFRKKLRNEHKEKSEELIKLISETKISLIDLTLAKIRVIEKELDK